MQEWRPEKKKDWSQSVIQLDCKLRQLSAWEAVPERASDIIHIALYLVEKA